MSELLMAPTFWGLFAFGSTGFWIVAFITMILWTILVEAAPEDEGQTIFGLVILTFAFLSFVNWFAGVSLVKVVSVYKGYVLPGIGVYVAVGVCWSIAKWTMYVKSLVPEYMRKRLKYLQEVKEAIGSNNQHRFSIKDAQVVSLQVKLNSINEDTSVPEELKLDYKDRGYGKLPDPSSSRNIISRWIIWWPFSMLNSLFSDLIWKAVGFLVDSFKGIYRFIVKEIYRKYLPDCE